MYASGIVLLLTPLVACAPGAVDGAAGTQSAAEPVLQRETARIDSAAAAIDRIFQPLPVIRPAQQQALRRVSNAQHLARARALGVGRGLSTDRLTTLEEQGRLLRLESSEHWIIRNGEFPRSLAVPAVHSALTEIGEHFQARLAALGAPAYRMEITSIFRTAADQAALRRVNPNAAAGESTHEFGTTFDILYSAFAAPAEPIVGIDASGIGWVEDHLQRYAQLAAERVAGRRSLELQAILAQVLIDMQREGKILVTLEQQQPVFHVTVARRL